MSASRTTWRRLLVGFGATVLATAGVLTATAAPGPGNIDPTAPTSLTIHKHEGDPTATGGQAGDGNALAPAPGSPLAGVTFTVTPVTHNGAPIDLTKPEDWALIQGLNPATPLTSPFGLGAPQTVVTQADGSVTLPGIAKGFFLVRETDSGPHPIVSKVPDFFVSVPFPDDVSNKWIYDVHVYPKNTLNETTPTKEVADPGKALVLGSTVEWKITAPVAQIASGDTYRTFEITDQLDPRLQVDTDTIVVTYKGATLVAGTDYTVTPAGGQAVKGAKVVVSLTGALSRLEPDTDVVVTLPTTVAEVVAPGAITNEAFVNTNDTSVKTNIPKVNFGSIQIHKFNQKDASQALQGAVFELYDAKNGTKITEATTGEDGLINFTGLWVGKDDDLSETYWIKETKAPAGYVLPTGDAVWREVTVDNGGVTPVVVDVPNTKQGGPNLPLTGGVGTAVFGGGGALLVVAAIVIGGVVARRRAATN